MEPSANHGIKTVLHPVGDLAAATPMYATLLGVAPSVESPYYVGFDAAGQHIGLVPRASDAVAGPVAYWHVDDLEGALDELAAAGATVAEPAREVGAGRRVATVRDRDGNVLGLLQDPVA